MLRAGIRQPIVPASEDCTSAHSNKHQLFVTSFNGTALLNGNVLVIFLRKLQHKKCYACDKLC